MISIVILDDDLLSLETYGTFIEKIAKKHGIDYELKKYYSPHDLMFDVEDQEIMCNIDIMFLDINMPFMNGIDVAKEARKLGYQGLIIFITANDQSWREAFDLNAFHYITKGEKLSKFEEVFLKAIDLQKNHQVSKIKLINNHEVRLIAFDDIRYFQIIDKHISVYYLKGEFTFKGTFNKFKENLDPKIFIQIHRNFLVSLKKLVSITQKSVILDNGVEIPIGRIYYNHLKESYIAYRKL